MWFNFGKKKDVQSAQPAQPVAINEPEQTAHQILTLESIKIGQPSVSKENAIRIAGQILVDRGCVMEGYIDAMLEREQVVTTYLGEGVAIPHGVGSAKDMILKSGVSVVQFPQGVCFGGEEDVAHLVIGIAGANGEHLSIISNLAKAMQDADAFRALFSTENPEQILHQLTSKM